MRHVNVIFLSFSILHMIHTPTSGVTYVDVYMKYERIQERVPDTKKMVEGDKHSKI